ncbi:phage tail protein [Rivularia sp. UHCC 0363]|uniref:phage tail protein n=1 Tax=Rivularia sp. UHCC 0363 TaxID=3110244 RepID=UPI002B1FE41F|nr:phage tail protein [Rivularia sp. UHCC 0363]MEA5593271.1 phage tail protein [Rivularia sp. UHCC 0363]
MNQYPPEERLYNLLPAIYRIRDQAQGEPLKALLAIAARELQVLEEDIDHLYENWFIETCDEWVVPYIGDLLDVEELYAQSSINYGQQQRRAYIANTIAYRRRKGTAPVLEQLTRDITDWRARAVEFFQRLATTQNINHIRPEITTVNLRQSGEPEFLGTPFEQQVSYSVNIGNAVEGRGFHNIANIGLYIWRLQSYPIEKATAKMVKGSESEPDGQYYTFSPLGLEQFPLFNQPQTETDILHLAEEINVPSLLRRLPLEKEINNLSQGIKPSNIGYFGANPVLEIFIDEKIESIPPEKILIARLKEENSNNWTSVNWENTSNKKVAVDPESGRLAFPPSQLPCKVEVSYFYGFSGDIGGGSYERNLSVEADVSTRDSQDQSLSTTIDNWNRSVEAWRYLEQGRGVVLGEIVVFAEDYGLKNRRDAESAEVKDNEGLLVAGVSFDDGIITVKAGTVTDKNGDSICLENDCQLDVSAFPGETLILFIAHQPQLGLPNLRVVSHGTGDKWLNLGVALKEAFDQTQTVITITDNKSYIGDLTVLIPADKTFKIMAADGYRPHLQGDLYVQGITPLNNNPGELILEGLLIEGKLTVLPGSLRSLNINHCTLVPQKGGLNVATWEVVEDDDTSDDWTLIAIAIYFLNAIRSLLGKGTPGKSLNILLKIAIKQAQLVFSQFRELIQWQCLDEYPLTDGCLQPNQDSFNFQLDNSRLTISIYRSICGALHLADTVPKLLIEDSIIDNGWGAEVPQGINVEGLIAIAAPGTAVECLQSTVFGSTKVRSLEASDSIFTGRVKTLRKQIGCMRFCFVPDGSRTPRRYLCQPDRALAQFDIKKLPSAITCLIIVENDSSPGQLIAGTAGKGVFSYQIDRESNENKWEPINQGLENLNITALIYDNPYIYAGTIGGDIFRSEDNGNTWINFNLKEEIAAKKGTGKIESAGRIVKGNETKFTEELSIGDIITAAGQKRIVTQIDSNNFCSVNTPFEPNLDDNDFSISSLILNTDITAFAVHDTNIFAGTVGGGVFRYSENSKKWTAVNIGITNLYITSLAAGNGYIFAGTAGGGVFRSRNSGEGWLGISFGLENLEITALTVDATGQAFVGTSGGGVFSFDNDSNIWTAVNQGLTNPYITAIAASSHDQKLLIVGTVGGNIFYSANSGGKWQRVNTGLSDTDITDLVIKNEDEERSIYVGTKVGNIIYSSDGLENWKSLNRGLVNVQDKLLVLSRIQPRFTSSKYGDPAYAQLSNNCAVEIRTGAEDGSEMGVFSYLKQPQRQANLDASLKEYLRFGLEVGIFYET